MNKQEILEEIAELKERLNNLEKEYDSLTPPNKRWRANKGNYYYYIKETGEIGCNTEDEMYGDNLCYTIGNYFKTREEAKFESERLKVIIELREWAIPADNDFSWKTDIIKYIIALSEDIVSVGKYYSYQPSDLVFASEEMAKNAIEAVGEERILKYYFRRQTLDYKKLKAESEDRE